MKEDSFKRSCYWANVYGCADSFILSKKSEVYDGLIVYIVSDGSELIRIKNELKFFNKNLNVLLFPSLETLPYDSFSPHQSIISERLLEQSYLFFFLEKCTECTSACVTPYLFTYFLYMPYRMYCLITKKGWNLLNVAQNLRGKTGGKFSSYLLSQ